MKGIAMTQVDLSKLDRLEERRKIAADYAVEKELVAAREKIAEPFAAERQKLYAKQEQEVGEVRARYSRERDAVYETEAAACADVDGAIEKHRESCGHTPEDLIFDDDGNPSICCVTGLAIFEDDPLVEDSRGRCALALALPWPDFEPVPLPEFEGDADEVAF